MEEKAQIIPIITKLQDSINKVISSPRIKDLVKQEEYNLLRGLNITAYKFNQIWEEYETGPRGKPITFQDIRKVDFKEVWKVKEDIMRRDKFVRNMTNLAGGVALVIMDAPAAPSPIAILSSLFGGIMIDKAIKDYLP